MTFNYEHNGLIIVFDYSAKDFVARCKTDFGELKYYLHMMFMCPMIYTEENIRNRYCQKIAIDFEKIIDLMKKQPNFIENAKREMEKELAHLQKELEQLRQNKSELKKIFKNGEISEIDYKQICKQLKDKDFEIYKARREFFRKLQSNSGIDLSGIKDLILGEEK